MAARDAAATAVDLPSTDLPAPEAAAGPAHGVADCLHLDDATRRDAINRLKSARGHLDGIVRMLEDPGVYCVDVLKQVKAVQGGLAGVTATVLRAHVRDHVATASARGDTEAIVDELMDALKYRS